MSAAVSSSSVWNVLPSKVLHLLRHMYFASVLQPHRKRRLFHFFGELALLKMSLENGKEMTVVAEHR